MRSLDPPESPVTTGHAVPVTAVPVTAVPVTAAPENGQVKPADVASHDRQAAPARTPRRYLAAAAALVRQHWLAAALLTAGLMLRVLAQLAYRPALFLDAVRYLYNAYGNDPVGYEGPLRAILLVGNFDAVVAFQHLLGLAMGLLLYLLLLRRGAPRWLAALAMAPVLLDAYQIQDEQTIMPGTVFQALIVAGLAILLWQPRPSTRRAVAGGMLLGTSAIVAQVGESLLLPAVLYMLVAGGGWRHVVSKTAALCAAFAVPILAYCTGSYLITGDFFLSHTGVTSVYGRMAAAADCATLRLPADERAMCPTPAQQVRGADWLEYAEGSPIRPYYSNLPRAKVDSLISDFNHRVLTQQPQQVLVHYSRDVLKLYEVVRTTSPGDTPISRWQFQTTFPYHPPHATAPVVRSVINRFGGGQPTVWRPVAVFLRFYQLHGGFTPGPVLLILTLTGLFGSAVALLRRRAPPQTRQLALGCLLLFSAAAAVTLAADLFEFSWRYQLPALVTLVPAGALGIGVIIRSVRTRRGHG
jgi:hypothetical protein